MARKEHTIVDLLANEIVEDNYLVDLTSDITDVNVTFNVVDSKTANAVTASAIMFNGASIAFTQSGKAVTIEVPMEGSFVLKVSAEGYNDFEDTFTYASLRDVGSVSLTPIQTSNEIEIKITWSHSETGRDLDSYMSTYTSSAKTTQALSTVSYQTKNSSNDKTSVTLDVDDTGSGTGETITIKPVESTYLYHLWINNYSYSKDSKGFGNWACTVKVTKNNEVVYNRTAATAEGKYWDVLNIVDGNVQEINVITGNQPS